MPELPEVQALADFVASRARGARVARVELVGLAALKTYDPPLTALEGRIVAGVGRRGKFLDVDLSEPDAPLHLVVHLARAGWLQWREELPSTPARPGKGPLALRVALVSTDGEPIGGFDLTEAGTKKGLAVYVVRNAHDVAGVARLGPEPLAEEFTPEALGEILDEAGAKQIKGVLRDQGIIAGIGNAYSDEILHAARLSPFQAANRLDDGDRVRLHAAIRATLTDAVDRAAGQGTGTLKAEKKAGLRVHGRTGQPCPVCGDTVREVAFADSSLQYCPTCQTDGKPLADRRMSRLLR
jgi:formamidopyrimidine-DNA glycosylase